MDEVFSLTTSFLAVYLLFRLAPFAKNLLNEVTKNYLCYRLFCVVHDVAESTLAYTSVIWTRRGVVSVFFLWSARSSNLLFQCYLM